MASVIKVILALQHQEIPKHLHFNKLNHNIIVDEDISLVIPTDKRAWLRGENKRIAGVSGFAFQGTNAHVIIEEAPTVLDIKYQMKVKDYIDRPLNILSISAKDPIALKDLSKAYLI